jgi:hypothetical protein
VSESHGRHRKQTTGDPCTLTSNKSLNTHSRRGRFGGTNIHNSIKM